MRPSVVDDFIRNFLIKVGMTRTLDSFNTEWYELQAKGRLGEEYTTKVPDIYLRNEELDEQVRRVHQFATIVMLPGTMNGVVQQQTTSSTLRRIIQ